MFEKVLIANRGEIALRVNRACKGDGHFDRRRAFDGGCGLHARAARGRICLHRPAAGQPVLPQHPRDHSACEITGADAIHPGYGFLSENAHFADIVKAHKIVFIGPQPEHIRLMGDKVAAKQAVKALGIPTVPGSDGAIESDDHAKQLAEKIGFPLLVKAAAGGGGRGMKIAHTAAGLSEALSTARAEAKAAFGDDTVYIEKYLEKPRHIEIQVIADSYGKVLHLGEARLLTSAPPSESVGGSALARPQCRCARRDRRGVTRRAHEARLSRRRHRSKFLYENGEFYFIEMNTRLQVEHPVTELITGPRSRARADPHRGRRTSRARAERHHHRRPRHRVPHQCEDPFTFRPSPGRITEFHAPGGSVCAWIRPLTPGYSIPPLLRQPRRQAHRARQEPQRMPDALAPRARRARGRRHRHDDPLFQELIKQPEILDGAYNIHWLENHLAHRSAGRK
jgi:acetyl-CoA carboxylase biotin carboxylase subunit